MTEGEVPDMTESQRQREKKELKITYNNMKRFLTVFASLMIAVCASAQDWANFQKYAQANSQVTSKPVAVFMGDSITEGWAKEDPDFFSSNNFIGRGISGQTTSHMVVRFRRDVLDHNPQYVVILAGTNDIARNNGIISLENILGNIQSMCEIAMGNGIEPVLCSVLPAAKYPWRPEISNPAPEVIKLNGMLKEYARNSGIRYVDFHSAMKDQNDGLPSEYAPDGIHPNIHGFRIMEKMILEELR